MTTVEHATVRVWELSDLNQPKVMMEVVQPGGTPTATTFNGSHLVTGSATGELRFWSLTRGSPFPTIRAHRGAITAIAGSDITVASAGDDGRIVVWEVHDDPGKLVEFNTGTAKVTAMLYAQRTLIAVGEDTSVRRLYSDADSASNTMCNEISNMRLSWSEWESHFHARVRLPMPCPASLIRTQTVTVDAPG